MTEISIVLQNFTCVRACVYAHKDVCARSQCVLIFQCGLQPRKLKNTELNIYWNGCKTG